MLSLFPLPKFTRAYCRTGRYNYSGIDLYSGGTNSNLGLFRRFLLFSCVTRRMLTHNLETGRERRLPNRLAYLLTILDLLYSTLRRICS